MKKKWQQGLAMFLTAGILLSPLGIAGAAEEEALNFDLEQVVVTATKTEKKIKDVPVRVEVITKEDLKKKHVANADDALKGISGVMLKRNNGLNTTDSTVIMRGFRSNRGLLVLIDGQNQGDGYNGQIGWNQIPVENIERIEVVKGPGSALYGSSAMGGVINIITKSKPTNDTVVKIGLGEQDTKKKAINHSGRLGKVDYFIDYDKIDSDGFISAYPTDTKNYRGHQNGGQEHLNGKVIYHFDQDSQLSLGGSNGSADYHYEIGTDQGSKESRVINLDYQSKVNDKLNYQITWGQKNTDNWYYSGYDPTKATPNLMHQSNRMKTNDGDIHANWQLDERNLLTLGYSLRKEEGTAFDERGLTQFYPDYTWNLLKPLDKVDRKSGGQTKSNSLYLQNEYKFNDKTSAFVGGRYVKWQTSGGWNSYRLTPTSNPIDTIYGEREESNFSSKLGVVYQANEKSTWKFNVGQGFRSPSFYELYRSSQDTAGKITTSNIDLKPEKSTSYDLNLDYRLNSTSLLSLSYFRTQLKDAITTMEYKVVNGYVPNIGVIPGVTVENRQSNADKALIKGFEVGLNKQLNKKWSSFINYTYTDAQITESKNPAANVGKQMNDIAKCMLNFGLDYKNSKWQGNISGRRISDTKDDGSKSGSYGSYDPVFLVDTKISYAPNENSTLSLSIDNLFNKQYWSYYLAPGRSTYVEYSYKF